MSTKRDRKHANQEPSVDAKTGNEGEGSRTAARSYNEQVAATARDATRVKKAAEEAKKAVEGPEGKALREAEERGKRSEHR